jgi:hypothetical protein
MPNAQFYSIKDNRYKIVSGQIDGSSPPSPGTQDRIFICTTEGGIYTLNYLYYDNGISWIEIVPFTELFINVVLALSGGTSEFTAHRLYSWNSGISSWDLLSEPPGGGAGDVVGPALSTDNAISRFNTTTGKLIQNSSVTIDDSGNLNTTGTITSGLVNGRNIGTDGSNLDSHISNTSNPHTVTKTQVGLGSVTDDSQLKRSLGDFNLFTLKVSSVSGDIILVEDSEDSYNKKKITIGSISHTILGDIGSNSHSTIDSHISDSTVHYTQASIDHTSIQNIGSNSHSVIDTHLSSTSNPHTVTKAQVGLSNVTNDAQLKRGAGDFASFTSKVTPIGGDVILLEDSADSTNKKYSTISSISHTILNDIGSNAHSVIDTHLGDSTIHYSIGSISHTLLQDIGSNSHATIDTHLSSTSNPHVVTKTQVSLGNVTNDAQLKRSASDFSSFSSKVTPISGDVILLEDSADSSNKKYITLSAISHTILNDIGSNPHSTIDSHLSSTSNPHSTSIANIGSGTLAQLNSAISDGSVGDVFGPSSSTDNAIARFDATTGKLIQNSNVTINDTGDMNVNNHNITNAQTITFNDIGTVTPSGGTITCEFDVDQKIIADLDDQASLTIQLNAPLGLGNFVLILKQGSTTPTTSITWVTEGTHGLYGDLTFGTTINDRTFIGLFYDGVDWYGLSSDMPQILAS